MSTVASSKAASRSIQLPAAGLEQSYPTEKLQLPFGKASLK